MSVNDSLHETIGGKIISILIILMFFAIISGGILAGMKKYSDSKPTPEKLIDLADPMECYSQEEIREMEQTKRRTLKLYHQRNEANGK